MWSGNVSGQGDSYPTQWALNPSAQYLHMPPEQGKTFKNLATRRQSVIITFMGRIFLLLSYCFMHS